MKKVIPEDSILVPEGAKRVFEGEIFEVYQWPQKVFDGSEHTFEMLKRPDTVLAMCIIDDKILVIDNEQPVTGSHKGFPGGRVDATDDSIVSAAQREVLEETGYSFKNWRLVQVWQPHTKIEWFVHLLLAWDVSAKQDPSLDAGEKITVHSLSLSEFKKLAAGKVDHVGDSESVVKDVEDIRQLLALQEFSGQTVDR